MKNINETYIRNIVRNQIREAIFDDEDYGYDEEPEEKPTHTFSMFNNKRNMSQNINGICVDLQMTGNSNTRVFYDGTTLQINQKLKCSNIPQMASDGGDAIAIGPYVDSTNRIKNGLWVKNEVNGDTQPMSLFKLAIMYNNDDIEALKNVIEKLISIKEMGLNIFYPEDKLNMWKQVFEL